MTRPKVDLAQAQRVVPGIVELAVAKERRRIRRAQRDALMDLYRAVCVMSVAHGSPTGEPLNILRCHDAIDAATRAPKAGRR